VFLGDEVSQKERGKRQQKDMSDVKNAVVIRVSKYKIDIKLKKKQRPSTTVSPFYFL